MRFFDPRSCRYSLVFLTAPLFFVSATRGDEAWPQWRGSAQNGVATGESFPSQWSETSGIAWKLELPGRGGSTPVVSHSTAYVTAGVDGKNVLMAFDVNDGALKWQLELGEDRGGKHKKGSGSNPSPVIDGDLIFTYFRSGDLACVHRDGKVSWQTNLQEQFGEDTLWWDLGSSPTLTSEAVVVAVMQTGPSYLVAYEKATGKQLWQANRELGAPQEAAQSYTTPLLVSVKGEEAIAVMGADNLTLHRAADGELLGVLGGFNPSANGFYRSISSPVAAGDIIVCPYGRGDNVTAVRMSDLANGKGSDSIIWYRDDLGSDVPTPAVSNGRVYLIEDGRPSLGLVSCLDIETGKTLWTVQLPMPNSRISFSSSPLIAGDNLYVTSETGTTYVVGPLNSPQPKLVSENSIDDDDQYTVASPAPAADSLLLRSRHNLYRVVGN